MAKIGFSKLKLKMPEMATLTFNDIEIEVKTYLPINEKLILIQEVINNSNDDQLKFYNTGKLEMFFSLEVVKRYTNISFTEKQLEDPCKLYDLIVSSGLYDMILNKIGEQEYYFVYDVLKSQIKSIYKYNNSLMGILDSINRDYSNLNLDATELQEKLSDPESLTLLKEIMGKLG